MTTRRNPTEPVAVDSYAKPLADLDMSRLSDGYLIRLLKHGKERMRQQAQREIDRRGSVPDTVKRPGRPPAAGTRRQVRVSLTLPPEYVTWLDQRGNRSEQVRAMIEREMQQA